jgi:2-polyprenyl-3-methyl-5-hydroxy-6-metoxy-1,4-benzoquinol methylase
VRQTDKRFEFGKNWYKFVEKSFNMAAVESSKSHMLDFLKKPNLKGLTFLDIGCGSGIHSLGALQAQADLVYSFDYDPNAEKATLYVKEHSGMINNWTITVGSVLDDTYIESLPLFDIVYSWGVLHHTGDVWHAIRNASSRVKPGGLFYIALYSADVQKDPPPEFWLKVKQKYVTSGLFTRRCMEFWYVWRFEMYKKIYYFPIFIRNTIEYKKNRGMNKWTDIRDWLGGWPMEFVYDADAIKFCHKLGFRLENIATGHANTEFLFIREMHT